MAAIDEARGVVEAPRPVVAGADLEMDRADPLRAADLRRVLDRGASEPRAPPLGPHVQLVEEGVAAVELEAVAEGHGRVACGLAVRLDHEHAAVGGLSQENGERAPRGVLAEGVAVL